MAALRSLLYAAIFYPLTVIWVLGGTVATIFGPRPALAVVLSWAELHHWLVENILDIRIRVEGSIPPGPHLIAVKHQSMLETLEMVRITNHPVIVIKKELSDIPIFGLMTRRYGVIPVERSAGARALKNLASAGKRALSTGRPIVIYPEGTRVRVGEMPEIKSGFTALYRVLGLPVVPVAMDSGQLWGRGFVHRSGTINVKVGETLPAGLPRGEIEARVHAAINAFELISKARA